MRCAASDEGREHEERARRGAREEELDEEPGHERRAREDGARDRGEGDERARRDAGAARGPRDLRRLERHERAVEDEERDRAAHEEGALRGAGEGPGDHGADARRRRRRRRRLEGARVGADGPGDRLALGRVGPEQLDLGRARRRAGRVDRKSGPRPLERRPRRPAPSTRGSVGAAGRSNVTRAESRPSFQTGPCQAIFARDSPGGTRAARCVV